ncbi:MAG: hypothetical protein IKE03_06695 [Blautia sp.]|nr:hypothetical protein [Blautia sp.]
MKAEDFKKALTNIAGRKPDGDTGQGNEVKLPGEASPEGLSKAFASVSQEELYDATGGGRPGKPVPPH